MCKLDTGSFPLIIVDPPYNYAQPYDAYHDNVPDKLYWEWTQQWLSQCHRVLAKSGSLWIFAPDEWVSEIDVHCRTQLKMYKRNHIVWYYTFGQASQGKGFSRSHTHLLYLTKSRTKFYFSDEHIRVPSARQLIYKDKRANAKGKMPDDVWMLLKHEMTEVISPDQDTWLESRVCGTFKERQPHSPNQLPVPLLERIVLAASQPNDLVLDAFCGSGSTGVAALKHGRRFLGIDVSRTCIEQSRRRILECVSGQ